MQLYFPYPEPIKCAECFTPADLQAQIKELKKSIAGVSQPNREWLDRCKICYEMYLADRMEPAQWWSHHADLVRPAFLTPSYCREQRQFMGAKFPKKYAQFNDSRNSASATKA